MMIYCLFLVIIYWFYWLFLILQLNVRLLAPKYKTTATENCFIYQCLVYFNIIKISLIYERDRIWGWEEEKEKVGEKEKNK